MKLIRGTDDKHPRPPDDFQPVGAPDKPVWLKGKAASKWDAYAPELIAAGVLRAIDGELFALYCSLCAEMERTKGAMIAGRIAQMRFIAAEFGIGAASRSKIRTRCGDARVAPSSKYFAEK